MKKILSEEQAAVRSGAARRTGAGTYTVILSLIVLAVLIAVNLLVSALPSRYTVFDLSSNKMYSISEASEKAARRVKEDVTLYLICDSSQGENAQMETFVRRYADMNSHITLKIIDPVTSPTFTKKYTEDTLSNYSIIVESARRARIIDYKQIVYLSGGISASADTETLDAYIQYYYSMYGEAPKVYFNGENLIISALDYVTAEKMTVLYTLSGHGEIDLSATLSEQFSYSNITSAGSFASLTATAVPADCDILFINAPTTDLNEGEAKMIVAYINAGGKVILTTAPGIEQLPNLLTVARACGLDAADGLVIEQDANYHYGSTFRYGQLAIPAQCTLLPQKEEHPVNEQAGQNYYMLVPFAHGIVRAEEVPAGVTIAPLFSSGTSSYLMAVDAETMEKPADAVERSYWVGASATTASGGKMIWLSSPIAVSDTANSLTGANYLYVLEMTDWLCPRETIMETIAPISLEDPMLTVTAGAGLTLTGILVIVIPLAFAVTGLVIWIRRRRR